MLSLFTKDANALDIFHPLQKILNACFVELRQTHSQALLPFRQISAPGVPCQRVRLGESRARRVRLNVFGASVRWYRTVLCHGVG